VIDQDVRLTVARYWAWEADPADLSLFLEHQKLAQFATKFDANDLKPY
jgi:hypothetical protein